jgi:hypothetical protein
MDDDMARSQAIVVRRTSILAGIVASEAAGIAGALSALSMELAAWPLSLENFLFGVCWGLGTAVFGAVISCVLLACLPSDWRWISTNLVIGTGIALASSFASMRWLVVILSA